MENSIDQFGVRVTPKVINFTNCEINESYVRVVNVQNISSKNLTVRFYAPQSKDFNMVCKSSEKIISSGLSHVCSLKYKMAEEEKLIDRLVVTVDGQVIEIPIFIYPSAPKLNITDLIDFGTVVMANKVVTTSSMIYNEGSKSGEFKIVYNGKKPLNINPYEGFVHAHSSISIQIEFVTREAQIIDEECQVQFEGEEPFIIRVTGEVVKRSLELIDVKSKEGKQMKCIKFPHTYYGSDRSETALLYNNSPETIDFVAILEEDAVGQESGSHVTMTAGGINPKECTNPLTSLITMYPNQGVLRPYEKVPVLFRFSPRWKWPKQAFKKTLEPPLQQTFAVFVKIQIVGSSSAPEEAESNEQDDLTKCQQLEVALTGTAAPILLDVEPNNLIFENCSEGQSRVLTAQVFNRSHVLSCHVEFPKEAHFTIEPSYCVIPPNKQMDLDVVFMPKQYGNFNTKQMILVHSYVKDENNPFVEKENTIYEHFFFLTGSCSAILKEVEPKFNQGLTPMTTNKVGYLPHDPQFSDIGIKHNVGTRAAFVTPNAAASGGVVGCHLFRGIDSFNHPYNNRTALIAYPNDRAGSIRPSQQKKEYRTIFKRTKRHNFVDPDYAHHENESREIAHHKDRYRSLIRKRNLLRRVAKLNAKFACYENSMDLGIIPGNYLKSPRLALEELHHQKMIARNNFKDTFKLLSSKELKQSENVIDINKLETFHAIPTTDKEKEQCAQVLSSQQLHQIVIGPSTVNFSEVAIRSTSTVQLEVVNNLDTFIHVSVSIDCKELRQSSPLSQVITAKTKSIFPLIFESNKRGKFQRNLNYVINGYYRNHVIVLANVVHSQLTMSSDYLLLKSSSILPPDSGIRGCVTLTNPLNSATEFLWEPVFNNSGGIAFSIRPKEGMVEADSQLDCEVTFHPSFLAPNEGEFVLRIPANEDFSDVSTQDTNTDNSGGAVPPTSDQLRSSLMLHCVAMLGNPVVSLQSRRVMFGSIPLNLATSRTAVLVNSGTSHAFFRVVPDAMHNEFPGMTIFPLKGSIPIGGQTEITIKYLPETLIKFDFSVPVIIRGWKEIEIKISGSVIIPHVEIDERKIEFGGVPVGSKKDISFNLINKSQCRARVELDFTKQMDFRIESSSSGFSGVPDLNQFLIMMKPLETIPCSLCFSPTEVASYDYPLQIKINRIEIDNPTPMSRMQTNATILTKTSGDGERVGTNTNSSKSTQRSKPNSTNPMDIYSKPLLRPNLIKLVTATAIRQPINLSALDLKFQHKCRSDSEKNCKKLIVYNMLDNPVEVCIKLTSATWKYEQDGSKLKKFPKSKVIPFHFYIGGEECAANEDIILNLINLGEAIEIEIFFIPESCGNYTSVFPVYLNNNFEQSFQNIRLTGDMERPKLVCQPDYLFFTPAPLKTLVRIDFRVMAYNFDEADELDVRLPLIKRKTEDNKPVDETKNSMFQPFKLAFATSRDIQPASTNERPCAEIWIRITFSSEFPINIRSYLELVTKTGGVSSLGVSAVADNCLLTWLGFFNKRQLSFHIVCDEGKPLEGTEIDSHNAQEFGEAQLKCIAHDGYTTRQHNESSSLHSRNSTTLTSSNFEESSVTYEESATESGSLYFETPVPAPREGALNNVVERVGHKQHKKSNTPSAVKVNSRQMEAGERASSSNTGTTINDESATIGYGQSSTGDDSTTNGEGYSQQFLQIMSAAVGQINGEDEIYEDAGAESDGEYMQDGFNTDYDAPTAYDSELMKIVERWCAMHGWASSINPFSIPSSLRTSLQKRFGYNPSASGGSGGANKDKPTAKPTAEVSDSPGLKSDSRDLYDLILYLSGKQIIGINTTVALPTNQIERSCHIYVQHATMIAFVENQLGQLAPIMPEFLMDFAEYECWYDSGCPGLPNKDHKPPKFDCNNFEKISKKAWTYFLMQMLKALVLVRVTLKTYKQSLTQLHLKKPIPEILLDQTSSNCYTLQERILLAWLNYLYDTHRHKVWSLKSQAPSARWIINFDNDFMDSVILATAISAYVPHMIETHFKHMYPNPENPEQFLHNALKIVSALKDIGMEFDVQAIDIVDPNPAMMLLLTMHLFQNLALYVPKSDITFVGSLHEEVTKNILVSNPTSKPLSYECIIIGPDAQDFASPKGSLVALSGKSSIKWPITFKSRFIRPAEAIIMFVGRKSGAVLPANLIFRAKSRNQTNIPLKTEKISEKCYNMKQIDLKVVSPYKESGEFQVKLIENIEVKTKETDSRSSGQNIPIKNISNKKGQLEPMKLDNKLRAFTTHTKSIFIDKSKQTMLGLSFMPMQMGIKTCQIIFSNPDIGEFVQAVEATALLPQPTPVDDFQKLKNSSVRVSTAEAAKRGLEGNEKLIYWKCEVGSVVNETIPVPIRNLYKEEALLVAAQHHLTPQEVSRRQVTGTLNSSSLLLTAVQMLTLTQPGDDVGISIGVTKKKTDTKYTNKGNIIDFEIEFDSPYFKGPSKLQIPDPLFNPQSDSQNDKNSAESQSKTTVELPISFQAATSGVYGCNLILRGSDDIRVHRIECTVTPEGHSAKLFFKTPLQNAVLQQLPIVNKTKQDWPLRAAIIGSSAFTGPDYIVAKALTVSQYSLQFKPVKEGQIKAQLCLSNEADGTEHMYELFGEGESPLALEVLQFDCTVGERISRVIQVPNGTRKKHVFFVESDLDWMITGQNCLSILPNRNSPYEISIEPKKSGHFQGILAFVSGKTIIKDLDSDGEEMPDVYKEDFDPVTGETVANNENAIYRIWYSLIVDIKRAEPKANIDIQCACLETTIIEIPLRNPLFDRPIEILVDIEGENLHGDKLVKIEPESGMIYHLQYTPTEKGSFESRIIFYEETVGEFWYNLSLTSISPLKQTIDNITCELGRWSLVEIPLSNLDESRNLILSTNISNTDCYCIHLQESDWFDQATKCFILSPSSTRTLYLKFTPCEIGPAAHSCLLTLTSDLLGEWQFQITGSGLPPRPSDVVGITAEAGSNRTVLVPFHNPMLEQVLIDISISEEHQSVLDGYRLAAGDNTLTTHTDADIFRLLLKNNRKLKLLPKQTMEIPISFAPQEMRRYNAICSVVLKKKSGEPLMTDDDFENLILPRTEVPTAYDKFTLRWLYPIKGIPEATIPSNISNTPLVQGPIRVETLEHLQFNLWGLPPPVSGEDRITMLVRSAPADSKAKITDLSSPLQDFTVKLVLHKESHDKQDSMQTILDESVSLMQMRQEKQVENGLTVLHYQVKFRPMKKFILTAEAVISSASGAVWRFPVKFVAHESEPDDEIELEADRLNKPVSVRFHLTSQSFEPVKFKAYFLKGADPAFSVTPESGELPPLKSKTEHPSHGLPFTVTWTPASYGMCKGVTLVIETPMMEWSYKFKGVGPRFQLPHSNSMVRTTWTDAELEKHRRVLRRRGQSSDEIDMKPTNFIRQNLDLLSTAVSSPIKGAPLFPRIA